MTMSLKPEMFKLCAEVAAEFENWSFVSDVFKNKALKHTDLVVWPGFSFFGGVPNPHCSLQPAVDVVHKKSAKLFKQLIGYEHSTSFIRFISVADQLQHYPKPIRGIGTIWRQKFDFFLDEKGRRDTWSDTWLAFDEARPAIKGLLTDGIALIEKYYDLSSEESLLRHLPMGYGGAEGSLGVMLCVVHVYLGDFDFVKHYRSDDFKTRFPKRLKDVDAIIAALPELKRRYDETGSVI